ncbi:site-2 protease family protein [Candidatus Protochlamydia sp. R18]|uniref:site-2 protease family protein n=1 Tax=Candidatus Protochlamydia sp. R18 TaxID=1353977 RepID=UPI0005A752D4|nr:M50 family metallopeptidase [Candidatus Protochlamydia sp. R18]
MISISSFIPIRVFPFFWFLIAMIGWLNSQSLIGTAIWSLVILISILIHEYGHALTALAFGQKAEIDLVGLGGVTRRTGKDLTKWQEFLVVLNGPLAGFVLFFLVYWVYSHWNTLSSPLIKYAFEVAIHVNIFWTLLNLLPVLPLDGGHLLRIILESLLGIKGLKLAFFLSVVLAAFLCLYFFSIQQFFVGALFLMMGFESYRSWIDVRKITAGDADTKLQKKMAEAIEKLRMGNQEEAFSKFVSLREQASQGVIYVTATQYMAHILADQGQYKQAYEWLISIKSKLSLPYLKMLQQLAYRLQEWEMAVKIGNQIFQQDQASDIALINALSYAIMGEAKPAIGWLRSAEQVGLSNLPTIIQKREFDAIRDLPEFKAWLNKNS